jgi:ubiquinone/menaquinone biosynthesis C-methylase UbiE
LAAEPIRFEDGAAYERGMGAWSQLVGQEFLDWLAPAPDLSWIDVGCGNGAFTELVLQHCAPAEVFGVDPSTAQIAFASARPGARGGQFQTGDAMALPFDADRFDVAVMALVIFFVPEPRAGLAEMVRVVRPGGLVAAYAWDILGGGFPMDPIQAELRAGGITPTLPPHPEIARAEALRTLWSEGGLEDVEQRTFTVQRRFQSFDEFWTASTGMGSMKALFERMPPAELEPFKARVRARVAPADASGRIVHTAYANAAKGRRPRS